MIMIQNAGANPNVTATTETNGTGGLIIIVAKGNVTVNSGGTITVQGGRSKHTTNGNDWVATGGAAGGGNIIIAHKGTYTNNGTVTAAGGTAGVCYSGDVGSGGASGTYHAEGGNGGVGSIQTLQIL